MQSFQVKMNIQSVSARSLLTEQIQKQVVPLQTSEVYLSIDIKYVGVITKESTWKFDEEMLRTAGIQCIYGAMAWWTVEPDLLTCLKCLTKIMKKEWTKTMYKKIML